MGTRTTDKKTKTKRINCDICGEVYQPSCDWNQGRCPHRSPMVDLDQLKFAIKLLWNRFFGDKKMQVRVTEDDKEFGKCGCGRSPTGYCIGWHGLTESQYKVKLEEYKQEQQGKQ